MRDFNPAYVALGQLSPSAVRATQRDATAMPRNLTHFGSARRRGVCARSRLMRCSKQRARANTYSITSSARASSVGGTSSSSAFAVFMLMTSSKRVGCSTGRSAGRAPFRILSTYTAAL
jgi:hypothetical protein